MLTDIRVEDKYFSNNQNFELIDGQLNFNIDTLSGKESIAKQIKVIPKHSGEIAFSPATFSYKTSEQGSRVNGIATNKPVKADIISHREYVLKSGWSAGSWGVFGLLSLVSVGLPYTMWKSISSGRKSQDAGVQEASKKPASGNAKKNKRA